MANLACISVINMKNFPAESEKLMMACRNWGSFRMINHDIPFPLMMEMKLVSRSLPDLPLEIKQRNADPINGKGYTPLNEASSVFEGLACYDMAAPVALNRFYDQLGASPHQREIISQYSKALFDLSMDLGRKLVKGSRFEGDLFNEWPCHIRFNKYNYTPQYVGSTGPVLHTDPGFLTILQDDELIGGLEAVNKDTSEYIPIDPLPGSLVVNLEDIAMIWSNGSLHNVKHRVQCYEGSVRLSIVFFVFGPKDEPLMPPKAFVDSEHPRLYNSMKFEDY